MLWHGRMLPCLHRLGRAEIVAKEYGPNPKERTVLISRTGLIVNHRNNTKLHQFEHILARLWRERVKIMPRIDISVLKAFAAPGSADLSRFQEPLSLCSGEFAHFFTVQGDKGADTLRVTLA